MNELEKIMYLLYTPSHVDKRLLKMERTDATIERFCDMCMAMSWDMAKCDYCEFRFRCYTH